MGFSPLFGVAGLLAAVGIAGCAQQPAGADASLNACQEPRPQVCTMIYAPVCAQRGDGSEETLSSPCNACADDTVVAYQGGACEDDSP